MLSWLGVMVISKLYHKDWTDSKNQLILGAVAAGVLVAIGGAVYLLRSGGTAPSEKPKDEEKQPAVDVPVVKEEIIKVPNLTPFESANKKKTEGTNYFKKSEYEKAINCYLEAVELFPLQNNVEKSHCYQNIAAASEKLDKYEDVVKYCSHALKLNQKYIKAIHRRAISYEKLKNYERSIKDWTAVCLIEGPQKAMASGYMATSDRVLKIYGEQKAKEIMSTREPRLPSNTVINSALDNIHMRDFHSDAKSESLDSEGDRIYLEVLENLEGKEYKLVNDNLDRAISANPIKFLNHIRVLKGIFSWLMVDYSTAISNFNAVINDPKSYMRLKIQAFIHRGEVVQAKGDKNRALADYSTAVQLDEDHPDPYLHRAQFYLSIESLELAIKDLNTCIKLDENFPAPWTQLVYGQYQMARTLTPSLLDQVFRNLGQMQEKFPTVADVYALYGQVLQDQRQFSAADEKFQEAQKLAPENVTYKAHQATLKMMAENNFDGALALLKEAIEEDPKCDFVLENLGMIYIQKQQYQEALGCFKQALELVKTEAEAAHLSALYIGIQCQWEVCEEYNVKPVSLADVQDFSQMMIPQN